jgi:hypothetical protein
VQQQYDQPRVQSEARWERPSDGWLKCNVDAGFFAGEDIISIVCVFRSSNGVLIRAQPQWYQLQASTFEGESSAMLDAVHLARKQGFTFVIF